MRVGELMGCDVARDPHMLCGIGVTRLDVGDGRHETESGHECANREYDIPRAVELKCESNEGEDDGGQPERIDRRKESFETRRCGRGGEPRGK